MSVSDPLLKRLKASILTLRTKTPSDVSINDQHPCVRQLCETLEDILRKGLKQPSSLFQPQKKDYWHWLDALPNLCSSRHQLHPVYSFCLNEVKTAKRVHTATGRGRLLLRVLLQKRLLAWPMQTLIVGLEEVNQFYDDLYSILGNEILAQIFLSLVHELAQVPFDLCLRNASFLDDTWQLPIYKQYEFVPCRSLGLDLVTVGGHQFIERVVPGGVADEDHKVEPGDILDEFLGYPLKRSRIRLKDLMKDNYGWPVNCCFIKARGPDCTPFPPLLHILRLVRLQSLLNHSVSHQASAGAVGDSTSDDPYRLPDRSDDSKQLPMHARLEEDFPDDVPVQNPDMFPVYRVRYVGRTAIGNDGGVHKIESGVEQVLREYNDPATYRPIRFELGEKEVVTTDLTMKTTDDEEAVIHRHAYPQISSCGRRIDCPKFFAYIAGESTCTISRNFECFVFEAKSDTESKTILCSIAQGFERTHWAL